DLPRASELGGKTFIDDRTAASCGDLCACELAPLQNPATHGLEVVRQRRHHRYTATRAAPVNSESSAHKARRIERQKLRGAGAANPREIADASEDFLEIVEPLLVGLVCRSFQGHIYRHNTSGVKTAIGGHQLKEGTANR